MAADSLFFIVEFDFQREGSVRLTWPKAMAVGFQERLGFAPSWGNNLAPMSLLDRNLSELAKILEIGDVFHAKPGKRLVRAWRPRVISSAPFQSADDFLVQLPEGVS